MLAEKKGNWRAYVYILIGTDVYKRQSQRHPGGGNPADGQNPVCGGFL